MNIQSNHFLAVEINDFSIFKKIKNQANDINLIEFFGTSETSFISYNLNQQAPVELIGVLFPNVELKQRITITMV